MIATQDTNAAAILGEHDLPAMFDPAAYLRHPGNADIAALGEAAATAHYRERGREQGRIASDVRGRDDFLRLIPPHARTLEIGPFCWPALTRPGHDVAYLDVLDTEALRARAVTVPGGDPAAVPEIDYVAAPGDWAHRIPERFDVVFSSHNIEHQPCLVSHLEHVAAVLKPGGLYFLCIPDKRYCFDQAFPESTVADVIGAWLDGARRHPAARYIEHELLRAHNEPARHWRGDHGPDLTALAPDPQRLREVIAGFRDSPGYIDVHSWRLTPRSFALLTRTLHDAGLSRLRPVRTWGTFRNEVEFYAVLALQPAHAGDR